MNVSSTSYMQQAQMKKMDGTGNAGMGQMMKATIAGLPQETQTDIKSLMQTLDPTSKKDAMKQITEMDTSNMSVEDLTASIMELLNPSSNTKESSYPSSFSVYA